MITVVAAVICEQGKYLVGLRPEDKRHGGMWEFPGGKLADGESDAVALGRELTEELDLELRHCGALRFEARDPASPFVIRFYDVEVTGTPTRLEHADLGWFSPQQLAGMALAPSDARFVGTVLLGQERSRG